MTSLQPKRVPNQNELAFIHMLNRATTGTLPSQEEINTITSRALKQMLPELIEAISKAGLDGFWKVYDAFSVDYSPLKDWRPLIDVPAPGSGTSEEQRIITGKKGQKVFKTLSISDVKRLPRAQWQIPGIYQKVCVSLTYGDANTGKTFVDLDLALRLAHGMQWMGREVKRTRVLYIYGEGNEGLANRIEAWQRFHKKEDDTDYIRFICFPVQLLTEIDILCATIEDQDELPGLIVIDTFSVCAESIPENDNQEVAKFIARASYLKRTYKTHVHIIHHAGKNGDYRGAAAFRGNVDTMVLLSREDNEAPVIMTCKKQKDAPYFSDIRLQLEQVSLGSDPDTFEPITSCVVTACDTQVQSEEDETQERQKILDVLVENGDRMSTDQWRKACESFMGKNKFYKHKKYLVLTNRVIEEKEGPGKPVFCSIVKV